MLFRSRSKRGTASKLRSRPSGLRKVRVKRTQVLQKAPPGLGRVGTLSNACGAGLAHDKLRSENHIYRFRACPQQSCCAQQCLRCAWRSRCASRSFSHAANPTLVPSTAEQEDRRTESSVLRTARARRRLNSCNARGRSKRGTASELRSRPSCLRKVRGKRTQVLQKSSARTWAGGNLEQRVRGRSGTQIGRAHV